MKSAYEAINKRAVDKPGPHKKKKRPKQPPPTEEYCRNCGQRWYTERWCHSESKIIKGGTGIMGGKIPDNQTAWLCFDCDLKLSAAIPDATQKQLIEHAREWRRLIKESH